MARKKRCNIMVWRMRETSWKSDRANDAKVFRMIDSRRRKGLSAQQAIHALMRDRETAALMKGKTAESWKAKYFARK